MIPDIRLIVAPKRPGAADARVRPPIVPDYSSLEEHPDVAIAAEIAMRFPPINIWIVERMIAQRCSLPA